MTQEEKVAYYRKLSWTVLEARVLYYFLPEKSIMEDAVYDKLEKEYIALCTELGVEDTVTLVSALNKTRPAIQLILSKHK